MVRAPNKITCDAGRYIVSWVEQRTKKTKTKAKQTKNKYSYTTIDATAPSDMENLSLSPLWAVNV